MTSPLHTWRAAAATFAIAAGLMGCADTQRPGAAAVGGAGTTGSVVAGNLWSKRMEDRLAAMQQATRGSRVEVTRGADNRLKLLVPNDLSFDTNGFAIKPPLRAVLDPLAGSLSGDTAARVSVVGHTDSTGSAAVNNSLSLERAQSARDYLVVRGVSALQIETLGRGDKEPIADNAGDTGRGRNRRVEIFVREPATGR